MHLHSNATTNQKQRLYIQQSSKSCRSLAQRFHVSVATIHRWKHRDQPKEGSSCPSTRRYAFDPATQALLLHLRKKDLSLDAILEAVESTLGLISRAGLHRLLKRHGLSRLPKPPKPSVGAFPEHVPGFVHIDCFHLPELEGIKRYCFVAIDRATRLVYLQVYDRKTKGVAQQFLSQSQAFFPFPLQIVLTDNGPEFTHARYYQPHKIKERHPFDQHCQAEGIEHRLTKVRKPQTNGLVERMNGLIQQATVKRTRYGGSLQMIEALQTWRLEYNRSHRQRRLGRKTPYELLCYWYGKRPDLFLRKPAVWLNECSQPCETQHLAPSLPFAS